MNPNPDYYATCVGPWGDSIEEWAEAHGLDLEDALAEGVCSPDEGDVEEVYVPHHVLRTL